MRQRVMPPCRISLKEPPNVRSVLQMQSFDRLLADWQEMVRVQGLMNAEQLYQMGFTLEQVETAIKVQRS